MLLIDRTGDPLEVRHIFLIGRDRERDCYLRMGEFIHKTSEFVVIGSVCYDGVLNFRTIYVADKLAQILIVFQRLTTSEFTRLIPSTS